MGRRFIRLYPIDVMRFGTRRLLKMLQPPAVQRLQDSNMQSAVVLWSGGII